MTHACMHSQDAVGVKERLSEDRWDLSCDSFRYKFKLLVLHAFAKCPALALQSAEEYDARDTRYARAQRTMGPLFQTKESNGPLH